MKRQRNRIVCGLLTASIVMGQGLVSVSAATVNTQKEEVVYGMLDEAGNVTGIYVVNSFTDARIVDYGD